MAFEFDKIAATPQSGKSTAPSKQALSPRSSSFSFDVAASDASFCNCYGTRNCRDASHKDRCQHADIDAGFLFGNNNFG